MKTIAVVVTYNPDFTLLNQLIDSLFKQVSNIVIVDNSVKGDMLFDKISTHFHDNISIEGLHQNMGIAYAQNRGIKLALNQKPDFILLSDQDTVYPADYVESMVQNFQSIDDVNDVVALVPNFRELNRGGSLQGFIEQKGHFLRRVYHESGRHEVFQAIASGKFLVCKNLHKLGLFKEELFIDWVDLEWCWKAKSKGLRIIGCADVSISHILGDTFVRKFSRDIPLRSPLRHYYIVRNGVFLALNSKYLSFPMKFQIGFKVLRQYVGFIFLSDNKVNNLKLCTIAIFHGIWGKLGVYK
jgi:rhamnosyltransferase